jgi:hypothetical protein
MNSRFASIASVLSGIPSLNEAAEEGSAQRIAALSLALASSSPTHRSSEESKAAPAVEDDIDSDRHLIMPDIVLDAPPQRSSANEVAASAAPSAAPLAAPSAAPSAAPLPISLPVVRSEEAEIAQRQTSEQSAKVETMLKEDLFKAIRENNLDGIQSILSRNRVSETDLS